MTENQIKSQLDRLTLFGNLEKSELSEYYSSLKGLGYTEFLNAITWIISNHEKHSFPLPAEIIKAAKQIKLTDVDREQINHFDNSGNKKITGAFISALNACLNLKHETDFYRLRHALLETNKKYGDKNETSSECVEAMNKIKQEAKLLPQKSEHSGRFPKAIPGECMKRAPIDEKTPDNNLPF